MWRIHFVLATLPRCARTKKGTRHEQIDRKDVSYSRERASQDLARRLKIAPHGVSPSSSHAVLFLPSRDDPQRIVPQRAL
jgi:hypothetical protein